MSLDYQRQGGMIQNQSNSHSGYGQLSDHKFGAQSSGNKKKKYIIGGGILVALIVAVIVIVVVATGGSKKDNGDGGGGNHPDPKPNPPLGPSINPYNAENVIRNASEITGLLKFDQKLLDVTLNLLQGNTDDKNKEQLSVETKKLGRGLNNEYIKEVKFTFGEASDHYALLSLSDNLNKGRFNIPEHLVPIEKPDDKMKIASDNLQVFDKPFSFSYTDAQKNPLVNTTGQTFVFETKYIQIDMVLPTQKIYGFGERAANFTLGEGAWTMWSHEANAHTDVGAGGSQLSGVHPFCLVKAENKADSDQFFGMFFRSSNAQSPITRHIDGERTLLSYITIGGNLDIYFFFNGNAKAILAKYHNYLGKPALPPFWAMGFHSTVPADSLDTIKTAVNKFATDKVPLDGVWLSIPYMKNYATFSLNDQLVDGLGQYVNETLHAASDTKRVVMTLFAGLSNDTNSTNGSSNSYNSDKSKRILKAATDYTKYARRLVSEHGALVNATNATVVAQTYSNNTVFPNWGSQAGQDVWRQGLQDLYGKVSYDGVQLVMNEPAALCDGGGRGCQAQALSNLTAHYLQPLDLEPKAGYRGFQRQRSRVHQRRFQTAKFFDEKFLGKIEVLNEQYRNYHAEGARYGEDKKFNTAWYKSYPDSNMTQNSTFFLPFIPQKYSLDNRTLALNASGLSFNATGQNVTTNLTQYDVHSLFGHEQSGYTSKFLSNMTGTALNNTRPFVLSASTFAGTGRHAYHTVTRNFRTWQDMRNSIASIMNFNMFGMPMTGADVCGHYGVANMNSTDQEEICREWLKLATFYPFARLDLEPKGLQFAGNANLTQTLSHTVRDRYRFLSFMYGCLFEASDSGETCFDPLFYHYHGDLAAGQPFTDIEQNVIVGNAVKISPALKFARDGQSEAFFPKGRWVNLLNLADVRVVNEPKGEMVKMDRTDLMARHLMPGKMIPIMDSDNDKYPMSTSQLAAQSQMRLIFNRDQSSSSNGTVFSDDGMSLNNIKNQDFELYKLTFERNSTIRSEFRGNSTRRMTQVKNITIADASDLKDYDSACWTNKTNNAKINLNAKYDPALDALVLTMPQDQKGGMIPLFDMHNIFMGKAGDAAVQICGILAPEAPKDSKNVMKNLVKSFLGQEPTQ